MGKDWAKRKASFKVIDVRDLSGNFLPLILHEAQKTALNDGLCVIQSFEPKPLYSALKSLGFEHMTERHGNDEYRSYFCRVEMKPALFKTSADMPFKPTAILNYKIVDNELASMIVDFWEFIWENKDSALDLKTKLLLSMSNAIGASRFRQATRELIKAYHVGATVAELDDLFGLFAWNQGIGHFSSEIGPSTPFKAYKLIKKREGEGMKKKEILDEVMKVYGDMHPDIKV